MIMIRDHLTVLPLVFPPLWEISLGCAIKWGPQMTEASLVVSASPSHHSLPLFLDPPLLVCFPPSHSSSHRIWVTATEVKVSYSLPAAGNSDPCSAHSAGSHQHCVPAPQWEQALRELPCKVSSISWLETAGEKNPLKCCFMKLYRRNSHNLKTVVL